MFRDNRKEENIIFICGIDPDYHEENEQFFKKKCGRDNTFETYVIHLKSF